MQRDSTFLRKRGNIEEQMKLGMIWIWAHLVGSYPPFSLSFTTTSVLVSEWLAARALLLSSTIISRSLSFREASVKWKLIGYNARCLKKVAAKIRCCHPACNVSKWSEASPGVRIEESDLALVPAPRNKPRQALIGTRRACRSYKRIALN